MRAPKLPPTTILRCQRPSRSQVAAKCAEQQQEADQAGKDRQDRRRR